MHWFDYSIIRYMPNPKRGEIVNIGLVVYRSSGLDIRMLTTPTKARIMDGVAKFDDIMSVKELYKKVTKDCEDTHRQFQILQALGSGVFVSEKSTFSIAELGQYEKKISILFSDLVKPFSIKEKGEVHSRLYTKLKTRFKQMELLATDHAEISDHKVVANYPIDSASGLSADFMLKNGKFHISEVIDFNVNDINAKLKETAMKVMTFVEGKKKLGGETGCYFVYTATSEKEAQVVQHLNMAGEYSDRAYNLESQEDEASYFQMMAEMAGVQLQLRS